jgi:hypothetical protein
VPWARPAGLNIIKAPAPPPKSPDRAGRSAHGKKVPVRTPSRGSATALAPTSAKGAANAWLTLATTF